MTVEENSNYLFPRKSHSNLQQNTCCLFSWNTLVCECKQSVRHNAILICILWQWTVANGSIST